MRGCKDLPTTDKLIANAIGAVKTLTIRAHCMACERAIEHVVHIGAKVTGFAAEGSCSMQTN